MADETEEKTDESSQTADPAPQDEGSDATAPAPDAADAAPAGPQAAPVEPEEQLSPKERRSRSRSAHTGEARPARTIEERTAERLEKRRRNAAERRRYRGKVRERRSGQERKQGTPPAERTGTGRPRERQGVVVSDKADKTITVRIDVARQQRTYGKIVRTSSTLHAHDETNEASAGDTVRVVESRPLSRTKRWRLVEVLERAR